MNNQPKTSGNNFKASLQFILVVAFLIATIMVSQFIDRSNQLDKKMPKKTGTVLVETLVVPSTNETLEIQTNGTVRVRNMIDITPEISGRVINVRPSFTEGGQFKANDILFEIEPADYQNQVDRLQSEVKKAETNLILQEAESIAAIKEWQAVNQGVSVPDLVARKPQMDQARAELNSARAQLSNARLDLKRTKFTLPFDGHVLSTDIEIGQFVQMGQNYGTVYADDSIEVIVPIEDRLLKWFESDKTQAVISTTYLGRKISLKGTASRFLNQLDQATRFASLIVTPDNKQAHKLIPGIFVELTLIGPKIENVWRVPNDALQENQALWLVDEQKKLKSLKSNIIYIGENDTLISGNGSDIEIVRGLVKGATEGMDIRRASDLNKDIGLESN